MRTNFPSSFSLHQFANHSLNQVDGGELLISYDFAYVNGLGMFPTCKKKPQLYDSHEIIMTN
jgi:hypothetical protein